MAPLNFRTGYSIAACNIGYQLSKLQHNLSIFPIGGQTKAPPFVSWINKYHYTKNPPSNGTTVKIWHEQHQYEHVSRPFYGFPIFELDNFSENTKHSLKWCDYHIVCSEWAKSVLINRGINTEENIGVVPLGVDNTLFFPVPPIEHKKYIFLNVGKWEVRKGHDVLPLIFNKAFTEKDNVELWLVPHNQFLTEEETRNWIRQYKELPIGHKVKIWPEQVSQAKIRELINLSDCGIYPTRAEGWNLEVLETMACNKPVITTNYSGHTQFCNKENSYLVDIVEKEDAFDGKWFNKEGQWGKIMCSTIDCFVDYMRLCYEIRPTNTKGLETASMLTWRNSTLKMTGFLNDKTGIQ